MLINIHFKKKVISGSTAPPDRLIGQTDRAEPGRILSPAFSEGHPHVLASRGPSRSLNQEAFGECLGGGGVGAGSPEGPFLAVGFRLHPQGRRPALGLHVRPVPMHPWPSPCRRSRAFPVMITISHASPSAAAEALPGPESRCLSVLW